MDSSADNSKRRSLPEKIPRDMDGIVFKEPDVFVTFIIGEEEKRFFIHKETVYNSSPVLKTALDSEFIEAQTQTYCLRDTTVRAFELLMAWMYRRKLPLLQLRVPIIELDLKASSSENESLIELWILADKLCIPSLQNLVLHKISAIRESKETILTTSLDYIYANTPPGSPLRRMKVAEFAICVAPKELEGYRINSPLPYGLLPYEFLLDLAIFWVKKHDVYEDLDISEFLVKED